MSNQAEFVFQVLNSRNGRRSQDMTGTMSQIVEFCKLAIAKVEAMNEDAAEADKIDAPYDDYVLIVGVVEGDVMKVSNIPVFTFRSLLEAHDGASDGSPEIIVDSGSQKDALFDGVPAQSSTPEPLLDIQNRI